MIYQPIGIISLRICEILDSTFFIAGFHTFPFGLHILVALHAQIIGYCVSCL